MSKDKKKKKQKVKYIDDGRSFADMSGVGGGWRGSSPSLSHGTRRDQAKTFFTAMKLMIVPMLVTMGIIAVAFLVMWLLLTFAGC